MEHQKSFLEVVNTEKQMLALIYSKGILHDDVLELYRRIRTGYEKILFITNQIVELQEVEHHLWKLHYELIDEFRKRIKQRSYNAENIKNSSASDNTNSHSDTNKGLEGFKFFLSEATEFYKKLIVKLRRNYGLPPEIFLNNKDHSSFSVEPTKLLACQHTSHRLLICLGDLARYTEIVKKPDMREWSTAATYYLEATRLRPDGGNPHNQLALLATYVGDAFLALYHCIRSLAVKEPFPDAWRNIMLLFEENRSTKLPSLSSERKIDFLNPSGRSYLQNTHQEEKNELEDLDNVCSEKFELWPILVRTISFLLIRSSLEEYPSTLASSLHRLDTLLAVDDTKLTTALECYQRLDSSRKGPYRGLQLVSIFVFIVHSLTESPEQGKDDPRNSGVTPLAFAAIFICMGRFTERCLRGKRSDICPLLPAVLVFLEWLVGALDRVETYDGDERVVNALSYFFGALAGLVDRIKQNGNETAFGYTALWEDHEMRGFYPLASVHEMLDFTSHLECMDDYNSRNECRCQRVVLAATRIIGKSKSSQLSVSYDKVGRVPLNSVKPAKIQEHDEQMDRSRENEERSTSVKIESYSAPRTQSTTEEEEVILFKPLTRRNSAPLYISKPTEDPACPDESQVQRAFANELLRRATSLSTAQNAEDGDSFSFDIPLKQIEPLLKDSTSHPTGPPSLSGWVLSKTSIERDKGLNDFNKQKLIPIDETVPTSFVGLSVNETKDPEVATEHISTIVHDSSYVTPTPSAPLLPDDATWLRSNPSISLESDGILGAAPISGRSTLRPSTGFVGGLSGYVDVYPPLLSSSEWLHHYRNGRNLHGNHISPIPFNAPPTFANFHPNELLFDQWGNHLVSNPMLYWETPELYTNPYVLEEQRRDKFFIGYQKPFPYVCGVGMELSTEQPPLLQYLKEKERQLQPGSQHRGPTFMGN